MSDRAVQAIDAYLLHKATRVVAHALADLLAGSR
jgi:hypothetical protein